MNITDDIDQINFMRIKTFTINFHKYAILFVYIISNLGNILSYLVYCQRSWRKNVCIFYFKIFLLVNTCYLNSYTIRNIISMGFEIYFLETNKILCKLYSYLCYFLQSMTPSILILATIDRLLISSRDVNTRLYSSKRLAYFSISITAIIWLIVHIHALIELDIIEIDPSFFLCTIDLSKSYFQIVTYCFVTLYIIACILMIVLCILSFKNVRHIHVLRSKQRNHELRLMTKKDFQLLRCLFAQDIIYITFAAIVMIHSLFQVIKNDHIYSTMERIQSILLNQCVTSFFNIYYSAHFLIFFSISKGFRHEFKRMICKVVRKNIPLLQEDLPIITNVK